jgi:hypothetical protein
MYIASPSTCNVVITKAVNLKFYVQAPGYSTMLVCGRQQLCVQVCTCSGDAGIHLKLQVQIMPRSGATTGDECQMDTVTMVHVLQLE